MSKNQKANLENKTNEPTFKLSSSKGVKYINNENSYHVFLLERTDKVDGYYYNLVVHDHSGILEKYIYKYPLDKSSSVLISKIGNGISGKQSKSASAKNSGGDCNTTHLYNIIPCPCVGHLDPYICFCLQRPIWTYSHSVTTCTNPNPTNPNIEEPDNDDDPDIGSGVRINSGFDPSTGCYRSTGECYPDDSPDPEPYQPNVPLPTLEPDFDNDKGNSFLLEKLGLSDLQKDWLDKLENISFKSQIKDYLIQFVFTDQFNKAKSFAQQAVIVWIINPNTIVDFEDNIIYDNSLNNFPCQKLVIQDAIGTCSPLTQLILDIFEANDGTNLILKSSSTLSNVNANTSSSPSYNATTHTCDITITFRESYLQTATDLAIARTAIHESLHATLVYTFEENLLQSANGTPMDGFEDFVEAYVNHVSGLPVNLNKAHHELMADFIEDIASSLSVYGASNGHSNSFNFYKKLSWSGDILKTPTYQSLYPEYLNPTDATANPSNVNPIHLDIVNTSAAEENDATYEYTHPNGTTYTNSPKGTAPNASEPCN